MSENSDTFSEILKNGLNINVKIWKDKTTHYMTYNIPAAGFEDASEQELIKLVSGFDSFSRIPAEYTRQAGIADEEDAQGNPVIELTFVLGNVN
jgi:hypothetical protein